MQLVTTNLFADRVKYRNHVPHMCRRERWVYHFSLSPVNGALGAYISNLAMYHIKSYDIPEVLVRPSPNTTLFVLRNLVITVRKRKIKINVRKNFSRLLPLSRIIDANSVQRQGIGHEKLACLVLTSLLMYSTHRWDGLHRRRLAILLRRHNSG